MVVAAHSQSAHTAHWLLNPNFEIVSNNYYFFWKIWIFLLRLLIREYFRILVLLAHPNIVVL